MVTMDADAKGRSGFVGRLTVLRNRMCQMSDVMEHSEQDYMDEFVSSLKDLGMGCVIEAFPPSRIPSCRRGQERYVAAHMMEIYDLTSGLSVRFVGRTFGTDREALAKGSLRSVLEVAGMISTGSFEQFRCLDIGTSEYSRNLRLLSADVRYVAIRIVIGLIHHNDAVAV